MHRLFFSVGLCDSLGRGGWVVFPGGQADKLGNRYEAKWLIRQLLNVIDGRSDSLCFEGTSAAFHGFEFSVTKGRVVEWHQTKINNPNGNWTISALNREGVLTAFKRRFEGDDACLCVFVSQDPAKNMRELESKAKITNTLQEYLASFNKAEGKAFPELLECWTVDGGTAFSWLKRCHFRVESQDSIEESSSFFADQYFQNGKDAFFGILRDFMERHFNKNLTTESVRSELREEKQLHFKSLALDPTMRERLAIETEHYLETYTPHGAAGQFIPRAETKSILEKLLEASGPAVTILTGQAGSGKSGVVRELIAKLRSHGVLHLAFRIDHRLGCNTIADVGMAITGIRESPVNTLVRCGSSATSVLIIDQVDAVSEVSGRNGVVKALVLRLVREALVLGSVRVVLACRTFDLENDSQLEALKQPSHAWAIECQLLSWTETVEPFLKKQSIDVARLDPKQQELLRLPLNLSLFLQVYQEGGTFFDSRKGLFDLLIRKKERSIHEGRSISWNVLAPLTALANAMNAHAALDAPQDCLVDFPQADSLLSSEGLIRRSNTRIHFFHESFFDYIFARSFSQRQETLVEFLLSSEQHLFRRTQVRQILEALRQGDPSRYRSELEQVLGDSRVRFHIKMAAAQWVGSLLDPTIVELKIALSLDVPMGLVPQLLNAIVFQSTAWFDLLVESGWAGGLLSSKVPERNEAALWWLSKMANQRGDRVAMLLKQWWGGDPDSGRKLLENLSYVSGEMVDGALADLVVNLIRKLPDGLGTRGLFFHTWIGGSPFVAVKILKAYYDGWFSSHPGEHPFDRQATRGYDGHTMEALSKKDPRSFLEGMIDAFQATLAVLEKKGEEGTPDYSFEFRHREGNHVGTDSFLSLFRSALIELSKVDPKCTRSYLARLDPEKHEVCAHLWLETIAANGGALHDLLPSLTRSAFFFEAGWYGANWKSAADALKASLPFLSGVNLLTVEEAVLSHDPETSYARTIWERILREGEDVNWFRTKKHVIWRLNNSGHEQWAILETIGESTAKGRLGERLRLLRRRFGGSPLPEPEAIVTHFIGSPIPPDRTGQMTDKQWLRAINKYDERSLGDRRRFLEGGANELARELQRHTKENPSRFVELMDHIPDSAPGTYLRHILWGLSEAESPTVPLLRQAILNTHQRFGRPFGSDIVRLFEKSPLLVADPVLLRILLWYAEFGEANTDPVEDLENSNKEMLSIEDLVGAMGSLHIRGLSGTRGVAAEAVGSALWAVPEIAPEVWSLVERRILAETVLGVRCCLVNILLPLYKHGPKRCALLAEQLIAAPSGRKVGKEWKITFNLWHWLASPPSWFSPAAIRMFVQLADALGGIYRWFVGHWSPSHSQATVLPLLTHSGVRLSRYLLANVRDVGWRLSFRFLFCGAESAQLIGAWHILLRSFSNREFSPLADLLLTRGVTYRRLMAGIAAEVLTHEEFRHRAAKWLVLFFQDQDPSVRQQAGTVFQHIKPEEFSQFRGLAKEFVESKAFFEESSFFHVLEKATCPIYDLVILATERILDDIEQNGNQNGRRAMDLYYVPELLKNEYAQSEENPESRRRILDLIDRMLLQGRSEVQKIVQAHEG